MNEATDAQGKKEKAALFFPAPLKGWWGVWHLELLNGMLPLCKRLGGAILHNVVIVLLCINTLLSKNRKAL